MKSIISLLLAIIIIIGCRGDNATSIPKNEISIDTIPNRCRNHSVFGK